MKRTPISPEGYRLLQDELRRLTDDERPRLLVEIEAAAAQGDRSENAEYIYGKKRLREIDRRSLRLMQRLRSVQVVERIVEDGTVRFGCRVRLRGPEGRSMEIVLVGKDEMDPLAGRIPVDGPMGKALLGRRVGESCDVPTPRGPARWTIEHIAPPE